MTLNDYLLAADSFMARPGLHDRLGAPAVVKAFEAALPEIARRAFKDGVGLDYFSQMIADLFDLIDAFHAATRRIIPTPAANSLWVHQKIDLFGNLDPRNDIDVKKVKEIAERYAASPFINNDYFSWCLLDSMICSEIRMFARVMASTQFGSAPANPAYFMSKGDPARYRLLKPVFFVLGILANYVTPALVGYYAIEHGHEIIGALFYVIAGVGVFSFLATFRKRQAIRTRNEALLAKVQELYDALDRDECPDARLHALFEEAKALGVRFDKIITVIARLRRLEAAAGSTEKIL